MGYWIEIRPVTSGLDASTMNLALGSRSWATDGNRLVEERAVLSLAVE
jgi:hypothetical protein